MTDRSVDTLPTTSLGHYKVRAKIGSGGMGDVFDALHTGLNKRVAIKTLRKRFLDDEIVVARFLREGQLASRIRHPNIVDVTDVGIMGGLPCLVMEHLEGESLSAMIRREGRLPVETIVDLLLPILAAADFAHDHGIVHRDLKPSNIFLSRSWNGEIVPKVLDFGISKLVHDSQQAALTTDSAFVGTPHYASPELMRADKLADGRSDQYSMGVILYEAVTGVRPFADLGNNFVALAMAICKGEYAPVRERNPAVPAAFEQVIQRAMALSAQDRFVSMRALGEALLSFGSDRARMIWAPTFRGTGVGQQSPTEVLQRPSAVGAAATVHSSPPFSSGTPAMIHGGHAGSAPTPSSQHSHHAARSLPPGSLPSGSVPHASLPSGSLPHGSLPSGSVPHASLPSGSVPHGSLPSGSHASMPNGPMSHGFADHAGPFPSTTPPGAVHERLPSYGAGTTGPVARPRSSGMITAVIGLSLGVAVLASVLVVRSSRREDAGRPAAVEPAGETFTLDLQVTPATALIEIDGVAAGSGQISRSFPRDGKTHTLRLSAPGYESLLVEFKDSSPPPPAIGLRPSVPSAATSGAAPVATGRQPPVARPSPGPAPTGKVKGNSDGRPKTDNIDPWE
ncbi:MAG: protein kinase [Labilithrix sp.]|nr:protein kinase [Labilithrix sp.]